jgi:predicted thioredoxin/glutaredoxin
VTPNPITDRIESMAQAIAERVVNLVMEAIDLDAVLDSVDIDRIIQRVDVDALIDRVDVEKIIERVDVNAVVARVDMDRIMEQTELGSIIARSTTGVASELLDVIRAQGVGLDDFFAKWANRLLRRKVADLPLGPPALVAPVAVLPAGPAPAPSPEPRS